MPNKLSAAGLLLASLAFVSCLDPAPPPRPRFRPIPPYPPEPVDRYDPYARQDDAYSRQGDPYSRDTDIAPPPPPRRQSPTPPTVSGNYPTAERTANPDEVISPYEPYNVINVEGFKSGQLARDPSNQKIFRVP